MKRCDAYDKYLKDRCDQEAQYKVTYNKNEITWNVCHEHLTKTHQVIETYFESEVLKNEPNI